MDNGVHTPMAIVHLVQDLHGLAHIGKVGPDERAQFGGGPD
jgi:hypothetical protein